MTESMNRRFGHKAMKESYITEAKLRFKKHGETFRDFRQAIQDLYRRTYPESREYVQEASLKNFLDNLVNMRSFASLSREQDQRPLMKRFRQQCKSLLNSQRTGNLEI